MDTELAGAGRQIEDEQPPWWLPIELWEDIFAILFPSVRAAVLTCRDWHAIITSPRMWRRYSALHLSTNGKITSAFEFLWILQNLKEIRRNMNRKGTLRTRRRLIRFVCGRGLDVVLADMIRYHSTHVVLPVAYYPPAFSSLYFFSKNEVPRQDFRDTTGSAIRVAVLRQNKEVIALLFQHGLSSPLESNRTDLSALALAASLPSLEIFQVLLSIAAPPTTTSPPLTHTNRCCYKNATLSH